MLGVLLPAPPGAKSLQRETLGIDDGIISGRYVRGMIVTVLACERGRVKERGKGGVCECAVYPPAEVWRLWRRRLNQGRRRRWELRRYLRNFNARIRAVLAPAVAQVAVAQVKAAPCTF